MSHTVLIMMLTFCLVARNLLEHNGPVGILNSNIFHRMKTDILFVMMVAVICVQNIEIEFVQVRLATQKIAKFKK